MVHAVVLWGWHAPALFEAAMRNEPLHAVQHLMFFGRAALFWWSLLAGRYGRAGYGMAAGADPLSDQTLAGLIMWVPAGAILFVFGLALLAAWVAEAERRARRAEAAAASRNAAHRARA